MPEVDYEDIQYLPTADLDDPDGPRSLLPDSLEYLCIHQILRQTTLSLQPNQGEMLATPPQQPNQVEMPTEPDLMDIDIPEDIPDFIDIPEEILLDIVAWAHSVLEYQY